MQHDEGNIGSTDSSIHFDDVNCKVVVDTNQYHSQPVVNDCCHPHTEPIPNSTSLDLKSFPAIECVPANISNQDDIPSKSQTIEERKRKQFKSKSRRKNDKRLCSTSNDNHEKNASASSTIDSKTIIHPIIIRLSLPLLQSIEKSSSVLSKNEIHQQINCREIPNAPNIRIIEPYPYLYTSHVKGRWIGRTVLDVYSTEFGSYPISYYKMAIEHGRIKVSNQCVDCDYILKGNDVLTHTVHRHEPAVAVSDLYDDNNSIIPIIADTDSLLVVDKPSTMPVHPCGGYHQNSLMPILESIKKRKTPQTQSVDKATSGMNVHAKHGIVDSVAKSVLDDHSSNSNSRMEELDRSDDSSLQNVYDKLFTIHRLDRLTSGLLILAKNSTVAKDWGTAIQQRDCEKLYLARVRGKFMNFDQNNNVQYHVPKLVFENDIKESDSDATCTMTAIACEKPPCYGEWIYNTNDRSNINMNTKKRKHQKLGNLLDTSEVANDERNRNALGYWISDDLGSIQSDITLQEYSTNESSIDSWLERLHHNENNKLTSSNIDEHHIKDNNRKFLWLHLACPVRIEQPKFGICSAGLFDDVDGITYKKTVKPAQTAFAIIKYDEINDTSILLVRPVTGRTHQIRIHLQYLNFPIANDPNYGGQLWFGNPDGEKACIEAQKILGISNNIDNTKQNDDIDGSARMIMDEPATENEIQRMIMSESQIMTNEIQNDNDESLNDFIRRTCVWCARMKGKQTEIERAQLEFLVRSPGLWLHALQYTVNRITFRTELPKWSK